MNDKLVQLLIDTFLSFKKEPNILEWKCDGEQNVLFVKLEDEDGMVEVYRIHASFDGYAKSPDKGNFEVVEI